MENNIVGQLLTGAVGGAIVSSVVGPYLSQARERRKARADALNALLQVETARWADKDSPALTFRQTVGVFKAAALVAGVDNDIVDAYVRLAATARDVSQDDFDKSSRKASPFAGGIPTDLSDLVRDAAESIVICIRHPWRSMLLHKTMLRDVSTKTEALKRHYKQRREPINWNIRDF